MILDAYIAGARPARLRWLRAASGHWTARRGRRLLASAVDPVREASAVAAAQTVPWLHRLVAIAGFGLGYHVMACARRCRHSTIVVFEPDPGLVMASLDRAIVAPGDLRRIVFYRTPADVLDSGATWYRDIACGAALVVMPAACPARRTMTEFLRALHDLAVAADLDTATILRDEPWTNALNRLNGRRCARRCTQRVS